MCNEEARHYGMSREDFEEEMKEMENDFTKNYPITVEELDAKIRNFANETNDKYLITDWENVKKYLGPQQEEVPTSGWYKDEYGNECQDYEIQTVNGCATTPEDYIADVCWKFGCTVRCYQDWVDGSPEYAISLPITEKEYQENLKEANNFWEEVYK